MQCLIPTVEVLILPGKRSEFTEVVLGLKDEIKGVRHKAEKSPGIPFMQESLSKRDSKNRVQAMSPQEREKFIKDNGIDETIRILR